MNKMVSHIFTYGKYSFEVTSDLLVTKSNETGTQIIEFVGEHLLNHLGECAENIEFSYVDVHQNNLYYHLNISIRDYLFENPRPYFEYRFHEQPILTPHGSNVVVPFPSGSYYKNEEVTSEGDFNINKEMSISVDGSYVIFNEYDPDLFTINVSSQIYRKIKGENMAMNEFVELFQDQYDSYPSFFRLITNKFD